VILLLEISRILPIFRRHPISYPALLDWQIRCF